MKLQPRDYRQVVREKLLPITLRHAKANVQGYSDLWEGQQLPLRFDQLPVVFKQQMLENPEEFRDQYSDVAAIQNTGGTTGRKLELHRCSAELEYIRDFFTSFQLSSSSGKSNGSEAPHCITAMGSFHGESTHVPYLGTITALDLTLPSHQDGLSDVFSSERHGERSSLFVGFESQLRIATCKLIEAGFNFDRSCVREIIVTGELVTDRLRRFYEGTWGVPLRCRYSMSEIFGGATACSNCGAYHCDPHIIGELVNPFTLKTERKGYGVLVLTCLYPFLQKQPMIRYFTGDVIYGCASECATDSFAFQMEGRLQSCIIEDTPNGPTPLITGHMLYNILDEIPDVGTSVVGKHVAGIADRSVLGHLKVQLSTSRETGILRGVTVTVEMRYAPYAYKERVDNLMTQIRESLIERSPPLRSMIADGKITLDILPALPGALNAFHPDEIE